MPADVWSFAPTIVQALIAGGGKAVTGAVEGAEDSARNGSSRFEGEEG